MHGLELHVEGYLSKSEFFPALCKYIFFINEHNCKNGEKFQKNSYVHSINTMNKYHLHSPNINISCFQRIHSIQASEFSAVCSIVSQVLSMKRHNLK